MSETQIQPTISDNYRRLQQALHENPNYGVASIGFAPLVQSLIRQLGVVSLSDYGAGKQNLRKALGAAGVKVDYQPYDPALPGVWPRAERRPGLLHRRARTYRARVP